MAIQVNNAVILAAGLSSRFAPLSYEKPKALIPVRGEILIERQIKQLQEAGITEIYVVTGDKHEAFQYLEKKFSVRLLYNEEYAVRNNHSSIYTARNYLKNSYICSSDNYFTQNPFRQEEEEAYYATVLAKGPTREWCIYEDQNGYIENVEIGGENCWYMLGHVFWDENFSKTFVNLLSERYEDESIKDYLWEELYRQNLERLKLKAKKYSDDFIFEFDSLEELRVFDPWYVQNSPSVILQTLAQDFACTQGDFHNIEVAKDKQGSPTGFTFYYESNQYLYIYEKKEWRRTK